MLRRGPHSEALKCAWIHTFSWIKRRSQRSCWSASTGAIASPTHNRGYRAAPTGRDGFADLNTLGGVGYELVNDCYQAIINTTPCSLGKLIGLDLPMRARTTLQYIPH